MRRVIQVILAVLTISFSAFLIERSCRDRKGQHDPDVSGGITKVIPPPENDRLVAPASPAASPEEQSDSRKMAKERYAKKESAETAAVEKTETEAGTTTSTATTATGTTSAAKGEVATEEKLQGTWVLTDGTTTLELTVVNNTGSLKGRVYQAGRSVAVEQNVRLFPTGGDTVYVYGSESKTFNRRFMRDLREREPIVLTFKFTPDGSAVVAWRRTETERATPLNVVSHVK